MYRVQGIFFALLMIFISGCGVYSFTGASIPPEVKTFTVEYFPNQAEIVAIGLSEIFTEKLKDKFLRETNLKHEQQNGHMQFSGAIIGYHTQPVAVYSSAESQLTRLTITIRVNYVNLINERENFETTISEFEDFDSSRNLTDVEQQLTEQITDKLAQNIFNRTAMNW